MHDDMTSMLILCLGLLAYSESVGIIRCRSLLVRPIVI